jgi:hypothetical protein
MTAPHADSATYDVGYGKPPRHTQFRKGRSGNPGGRPRRESIERLKALTLEEAYRGVVIKENDIAVPVPAVKAILRSQIELAVSGNVRAQRDILKAVQAYERADAEAAAVDAYAEELVRQAADLEVAMEAIKAAERAAPVEKRMSYVEAAERIKALLRQAKPGAKSETGAPGETVTEERDERSDAERNAAASAPSADSAPPPENDTAPAASPIASPPLSAEPPAAPPAEPRPWRSRPDRYARHRARESAPPPGANSRAGLLRNKCLRHRTGDSAQPFNVTWKEVTSRQSRPQKSRNSLLNSLFSGNAGAGRAERAPATTGTWRMRARAAGLQGGLVRLPR